MRLFALLTLLPLTVSAVDFQEASASAAVHIDGQLVTVDLPRGSFTLSEVPVGATIETFDALPKKYQTKATQSLTLGGQVSTEDVQAVLEAWMNETAIDASSIKIRGLAVGDRKYLAWCSEPGFFGCLNGMIVSGAVVEYEINGANRNGGMSGFQHRTVLIHRIEAPTSATP